MKCSSRTWMYLLSYVIIFYIIFLLIAYFSWQTISSERVRIMFIVGSHCLAKCLIEEVLGTYLLHTYKYCWFFKLAKKHGLMRFMEIFLRLLKQILAGQCSLVGASSHKLKGYGFDSPSGHMPGLWVWSQLGLEQEATNWCFFLTSMFLSLSLSLSCSLPSPLLKICKHVLSWGLKKKDKF